MGKSGTEYPQACMDLAIDEDGKKFPVWRAPYACRVTGAYLIPGSTVAKADTNYNTYALVKGSTTIASIANGPNSSAGTSFTAGTAQALTVTETDLAAGDLVYLTSTKAGNGLAMNEVQVQLVIGPNAQSVA